MTNQQPQYPQGQYPPGYAQPYPPQAHTQPSYAQPQPHPHQPMQVKQVGKSVTKPAWTVGDILWIVLTAGMAWPIIWLKRRARTTVTRYE